MLFFPHLLQALKPKDKDTKENPKRMSKRGSQVSEGSSRRSSRTSDSEPSSSEGSDSEDFDTGADNNPLAEASFDFLTFVGILCQKSDNV